MDDSHILNKKIFKIYWEIGAITPFFHPQITKRLPLDVRQKVMGVINYFLGVLFPSPFKYLNNSLEIQSFV
jgi:hypothetical protein